MAKARDPAPEGRGLGQASKLVTRRIERPTDADHETAAPQVLDEPVSLRHPGKWISTACVLVLVAMLVHSLLFNPNYEWGVVGHYFFSGLILRGLVTTIELTVISMSLGIAVGTVFAIMRLSTNYLLRGASIVYIWFFRGAPLLVQLIFWYNLAYLYPRIGFGIPFGPQFVTVDTNRLISPLVAAILGLSLNEGAYMAEIVRSGILAVDSGQTEAAQSLGMSRGLTLRRVVLPQAMRVIIPPTGNELIGMLKNTSLVSVMAISELFFTVQSIYFSTYQTMPMLIVASLWYLLVVSLLTVVQSYVEQRFGRGHESPDASRGFLRRFKTNLTRWQHGPGRDESAE